MAQATLSIDGYLSADAEIRFTQSGIPVANFTVPVTPQRRTEDGQWEDTGETAWYRCTLWGPLAELLANGLLKGTHVKLTGNLTVSSFQAKDGTTRQSMDVRVDQIGVVERRQNQQGGQQNGQRNPQQGGQFGQQPQQQNGWGGPPQNNGFSGAQPNNDPWQQGPPQQGGHPSDPPF